MFKITDIQIWELIFHVNFIYLIKLIIFYVYVQKKYKTHITMIFMIFFFTLKNN